MDEEIPEKVVVFFFPPLLVDEEILNEAFLWMKKPCSSWPRASRRCPFALFAVGGSSRASDTMEDERSQILVAMKGHPGCAKSTVARSLARALRCPVIDKDDVRDCTLELEHNAVSSVCKSTSHAANFSSSVLNTLSYDVMWKIVETQLQVGLSVIIDCPLARPDLLKTACSLADRYGCRIMIVECRSGDENEWKFRLQARAMASLVKDDEDKNSSLTSGPVKIDELEEQAGFVKAIAIDSTGHVLESKRSGLCADGATSATTPALSPPIKMHKPSNWADIEKLLAGYAGCWEYDTGTTSKIVVDTTALSREAAAEAVLHWLDTERYSSSPTVQFVP